MTALPRFDPVPDPGPGLLERALAYTSGALATVTADDLDRPTPCTHWALRDLLAHMEESLDAFTEGAAGAISMRPAARTPAGLGRIDTLRSKACDLLGSWTGSDASVVVVGGHPVPVDLICRVAAIEIAVHGWDVGRATGRGAPLPDDLALTLLPAARVVVTDQAEEFAPRLTPPSGAGGAARLLALLGRDC